eukprot:CAMPEP_0184313372 /NCGR_PEP_ID=MMETSP1049-20130417/62569_1 /TAXON_ID=77928 /ORGANISM="Proteomonas sulcata, Strain CCMP704" /LENGTH=30 /DNA_ID= /DNA_START= /DNA_END= /DNA_ORIENTATION=
MTRRLRALRNVVLGGGNTQALRPEPQPLES